MSAAAVERMVADRLRPRSGDVQALGAVAPPVPQRDVAFERSLTAEAAETVHAGAAELSAFAEARAGDGPVRDLASRDFGREVREELADARNYLCWMALQQMAVTDPDEELIALVLYALASVAQAYEYARRMKRRQAGA